MKLFSNKSKRGRGTLLHVIDLIALLAAGFACAFASSYVFGQESCSTDPATGQRVCSYWPDPRVVNVDGGSGGFFAIDGDPSYIITCQHGYDQVGETTTAIASDGSRWGARVVALDKFADVALLKISGQARHYFELAEAEPPPGAQLVFAGFPITNQGRYRAGTATVTGYGVAHGDARGVCYHGDSGAPLIDGRGRLAGILSGHPGGPIVFGRLAALRRLILCRNGSRGGHGGAMTRPSLPSTYEREPDQQPAPQPSQPVTVQPASAHPPIAELEQRVRGLAADVDLLRTAASNTLPGPPGPAGPQGPAGPRGLVGAAGAAAKSLALWQLLAIGGLGGTGTLAPLLAGRLIAGGWRRLRNGRGSGGPRPDRPFESSDNEDRGARRQEREPRIIPIAVDTRPPKPRLVPETHVVEVPDNQFARAYQWGCEQLVRKYPGADEQIATLDSLIKQQLTASQQE